MTVNEVPGAPMPCGTACPPSIDGPSTTLSNECGDVIDLTKDSPLVVPQEVCGNVFDLTL